MNGKTVKCFMCEEMFFPEETRLMSRFVKGKLVETKRACREDAEMILHFGRLEREAKRGKKS